MEAIGDIARRIVEKARDQRSAVVRDAGANGMPGMQPHAEEKEGPMPERDGNPGRGGLEVLALHLRGRGEI